MYRPIMTKLVRRRLHDTNRLLIAFLSLLSLIVEGWAADLFVMSAVLMWLWLPECEVLMLKVRPVYGRWRQYFKA